MDECLLHLVITPNAEGLLLDWLITSDLVQGFSSMRLYGHSHEEQTLSQAEQVEGRQWQMLYLVKLPKSHLAGVIADLRRDLKHIGIEYWVTPVLESGKIE